jgi:paraquat-inducible protein B
MNIHAFHGGALRKDMSHVYHSLVPESMRESVSDLGREAVKHVLRNKRVKKARSEARQKYEEIVPEDMRESVGKVAKAGLRHALDGGSMKTRAQKAFVKVVPNKAIRKSLVDLGKTATHEAVNAKPVTKVRRQIRDKYNESVPQSLKEPLKDLGEASLKYGKKKMGYGLKKGSAEMKERMAKLRAMRKKKMTGGDLPPRSRSYITSPELL